MTAKPLTVAIVNTNPDIVRLLRVALEAAGFLVFIIHIEEMKTGAVEVETILKQHDPQVIVYDVPPPFELNWKFLEHLRAVTGFKGRRFVLTTMNVSRLQDAVRNDELVYEIVGDSRETDAVVRAVKEASRARPTR